MTKGNPGYFYFIHLLQLLKVLSSNELLIEHRKGNKTKRVWREVDLNIGNGIPKSKGFGDYWDQVHKIQNSSSADYSRAGTSVSNLA